MKLLVETDVKSREDKEAGTLFGGKTGWWLSHNWLQNAGVGSGEYEVKYTYPGVIGKLPKRTKKDTSPAPVVASGIWDSVVADVPLLLISDASARVRLGVDSVANWHGHIDVVGGRVTGCTYNPKAVMSEPNLLPLVIQETMNLLQASKNPALLARPEVIKGIVPYAPGSEEVVVDLEWHYTKAVKAKKATKTKEAVAAQPARSGDISVVGVAYGEDKAYSTYDVGESVSVLGRILSEGKRFIGHNIIKADLPQLKRIGLPEPKSYRPEHIIDTMIVAHLIHPHWAQKGLYGLEDLVRFYRPTTGWKSDKSDLLYYNGLDAVYNYRLWKDLEVDLGITDQWHLVEKDQRLAHMAHLMRVRGMRIDSDGVRKFNVEWSERRADIAQSFPFNPNSPKQVMKWFSENGKKIAGTDYDQLVQLFRASATSVRDSTRLGPDGSLIVMDSFRVDGLRKPWQLMMYKLIQFRDEGKGLKSWFDQEAIEGGRIYPNFNVTGTSVARFSSSDPNAQNLPGWARKYVLAQNDDEFLASFDGKNIEGRTVARAANDEQMLADFASGIDIHRVTASRSFNKRLEDVTSAERQAGKAIVHASNYLETAPSLAGRLYGNVTRDSIIKAQKLQETYFSAYRGIAHWHQQIKNQMSFGDVTIRNSFGRVRSIYDINDHERAKRACHFLGCSDGADVVNQRALDVWDETGHFPQSIVHDELLYSFPKGEEGHKLVQRVKDILNSPIEQLDGFVIPFDYKHGVNYGKHSDANPGGFVEEK